MRILSLLFILFIITACTAEVSMPNCIHDQSCTDKEYYGYLEKRCEGNSCCLSSLKTIKDLKLKESKICPPGTRKEMLRCQESYSWCVEQ